MPPPQEARLARRRALRLVCLGHHIEHRLARFVAWSRGGQASNPLVRRLPRSWVTRMDLEAHLRRLGERERRVLAKILHREAVSRDTTVAFEQQQTLNCVADSASDGGRSAQSRKRTVPPMVPIHAK